MKKYLFILLLFLSDHYSVFGQCAANGASNITGYITNITSGSINNSTGYSAGGYGNYFAQSTNMSIGNTYTVNATLTNGASYASTYRIWVDWNQNGSFADAGETVYSGSGTGLSFVTTFSPPAGAAAGFTRMRVSVWYTPNTGLSAAGCGTSTYGEVEDYSISVCGVVISSQPVSTTACATTGSAVFTLAATGATSYQWTYWNGAAYVNVANGTPAGAVYTNATTTSMTVANISTIGTYTYQAQAINGCSTPTNAVLLTTIAGIPSTAGISSPANASVGHCPGTSVSLNWTAATGSPSGYKLYFGTDAAATNIVNGTNLGLVLTYLPTLTANTTYYWKIVPNNACGDATGAVIWSFTVGSTCPCAANGASNVTGYITNITSGTINNSTGYSAGGYGNYPAQFTNMSIGNSYTVNATLINGASYASTYMIWVDWNQNGSFAEAGETVYSGSGTGLSFVTTFSPPAGAAAGFTRMRVSVWYTPNTGLSAAGCGTSTYGEVEDYSVRVCGIVITSQPSNTTACATTGSAVFTLAATGATSYQWTYWNGAAYVNVANGTPAGAVYTNATTTSMTVANISTIGTYTYQAQAINGCSTPTNAVLLTTIAGIPSTAGISSPANASVGHCPGTSVSLNWTAATGSPSGYKLYFGTDAAATNIVNGTNLGLVLTYLPTLTANTTYYWKIVPNNACGDATGAVIWSFTVGSTCPCAANGASNVTGYITNITSGTINNSTGYSAGGYGNYPAQSTNMSIGNTYTVNATLVNGASYASTYMIWVDWNQNGSFAEAGENVYNSSGTGLSFVASFTPPSGAAAGFTRMRVAVWYTPNTGLSAAGCGTSTYGEVEDYSISVCGVIYTVHPANTSACAPTGSANLWVTATGAVSYQWQYWNGAAYVNVANGTPAGAVYTNATTASMTVSNITAAGTYQYLCSGTAASGCSNPSNAATLTIIGGVPGTVTLTTPANNATGQCPNSLTTLNWNAATGATSYKLFFGTNAAATNIVNGVNIGNVLTYNPLPLSTNSQYYWKIIPVNPCGDGPATSIRTFYTGNLCYCQADYTYDGCPYGMYISNFTTTGGSTNINNSTGCASAATNHYGNYTMQCVTVTTGSSFNISLTKATSTYYVGARIWIDLNNDLDFIDAGEDVWNSVTTGSSFTGVINIPGGTTAGSKGMRIRVLYNGVPATTDPCTTTLSYGETEDYCVTVVPVCAAPSTQASAITFSGVACTQMNVNWVNGNGSSRIVVAKQGSAVTGNPTNNTTETANAVFGNGSTVAANEYVVYNGTSNNVTVTGLNSGTVYYFKVFEYNCSSGSEKYNVTSPPSNNQSTTVASLPDAGKDQYLCTGTTSTAMAATGTGTWTQISGAATTITTPSSPSSNITGLASGTYTFRWTSGCGYDEMIVIIQ